MIKREEKKGKGTKKVLADARKCKMRVKSIVSNFSSKQSHSEFCQWESLMHFRGFAALRRQSAILQGRTVRRV